MFTTHSGKSKDSEPSHGHLDLNNPITINYEIGKYIGCCGPELIWKLYEGYSKRATGTLGRASAFSDREVTIFIYEKKTADRLHKPKRKETIAEILRSSFRQLERFRHPKILQVHSPLEESSESLAFATEPIRGSLTHILLAAASTQPPSSPFLDIELKYGLLQLTEALQFLHYSGHVLHRNICPSSVLVTKRGTWKLAGFEFIEKANEVDGLEPIQCLPWTSRLPKMGQPDLDYVAPEIQLNSSCSILSDMFSLGLVIGFIFNNGQSLIKAKNSSSCYLKQLENLETELSTTIINVPVGLQEALMRLLSKEPRQRPTSQLLALIKYFSDPSVHALQFLDVITMKDPSQKAAFYRNGLREVLPYIPRKLWFQHIWPVLQIELKTTEVLAAALQPILFIIQESSPTEFEQIILPSFRQVFNTPKSIQATVTLLENLHVILDKTNDEELKNEILPLLYTSFDSTTIQVQNASLIAATSTASHLPTQTVRTVVLPKTKAIYQKYSTDTKVVLNVLTCIEKNIDKLERASIIEEVLPIMYETRLTDPDINYRVVQIYRRMLTDKKYGLSINLLATRVIPTLIPQTVNPSLNLEQFTTLIETLQEMLDSIERNQRNKLKLDHMVLSPKTGSGITGNPTSRRGSEVKDFIVSTRKASSAEDMMRDGGRKNSEAFSTLSTTTTPTSSENFLRVQQQATYRRLSDNTLMPTIRLPPDELPIRRHSSTGPQERKNSVAAVVQAVSLRPTSASASAVNCTPSSRRPSILHQAGASAAGGVGLLQQIGTGIGSFLHKNIQTTANQLSK